MKAIPVEEAVGMVLCHDITRIVPGLVKGTAFRRGHIISSEDIPLLLDMGKANLYVYDLQEGFVHEDDAAIRLANAASGCGIVQSEPKEGKVVLSAAHDGVLYVDVPALTQLSSLEDVSFGTIHTHQFVKKGRNLAGTRVVPLVVHESLMQQAEKICRKHSPLLQVVPLKAAKVGVVTTGSEVYSGRIKDGFGPVLRRKFNDLGSEVIEQIFVSDDVEMTVTAIHNLIEKGADMIAVTGGMSVDPDDQTPAAIQQTGAQIISYGAPTFPGAMFLLAMLGPVPIIGLPGCVMYHKASIFDLTIPRILAGESLRRQDIVALAHGGFCESCDSCRYPVCGFGKL
jgi:molybdenum cofactor synthesis domain-containing protein